MSRKDKGVEGTMNIWKEFEKEIRSKGKVGGEERDRIGGMES